MDMWLNFALKKMDMCGIIGGTMCATYIHVPVVYIFLYSDHLAHSAHTDNVNKIDLLLYFCVQTLLLLL